MFAHSRQDSRQWKSSSSWAQRLFRREPVVLQLPAVHPRRNAPRLSKARMLLLATLALLCIAVIAILKTGYEWTRAIPFVSTGPLVDYTPEQLRELWQWEVNAGHYPSRRPVPKEVGLSARPHNPSIPSRSRIPSKYKALTEESLGTPTEGIGSERVYLDAFAHNASWPPRPPMGAIADLDAVLAHCDYNAGKYVRDCLKVLRRGAGLDVGRRVRQGALEEWKYVYVETGKAVLNLTGATYAEAQRSAELEHEELRRLSAKPIVPPIDHPSPVPSCDSDHPRLFHVFWALPFTDKPYVLLLSFLYTQNTSREACRPRLWVWVNAPNISNEAQLEAHIRNSPWAAPFLDPRFRDVIQFKLWQTAEQLDSLDELKDRWRDVSVIRSEGKVVASGDHATLEGMSVILSDLVRFVVCHRFGGVYLDADSVLLRDWEELWGWKGAFAYQWSRFPRYNTAVTKLGRQTQLGSFILRTALRNGLDFHPITISKYMKEANLEPLYTRLPDALFDSAWLNTDGFQRDRPPQPYFESYSEFFDTTIGESEALGFEGFFQGAFSHHYHNQWHKPFDKVRNWPELGARFFKGERQLRQAARISPGRELDGDAAADLSWSAVLKRTFESYVRGERPNMYGEWIVW
ncbi:uncharacterized protein SCHCODRAFT_02663317 [Schizophyllum commune H4-8]|uniref:uncharacterized protein n=1 Tax=Schizophyllum commune (strain H4-8 / FGSC 9210) TaxID=578458 RepID=UPI00215F1DD7|nr:uncharacterized protein SCHCODRAFT_02663317 [Schizophyllum commune H4-8]KAI5898420.1 hypothetical protein SCHCODRAFT_02663317 [Schizophyllum commune H4-8]